MESSIQINPGNFTYQQLPDGFFRLLQLHADDIDGKLSFELFDVDLTEEPKFFALSYVWGSSVLERRVVCNGSELMVTKSVVEALEALKEKLIKENMPIWIDAVCINQLDGNERNQQVRSMKRFYEQATAVIVWLGPEKDDSDLAMGTVEGFGEQHIQRRPNIPTQENLAEHGFPAYGDPAWKALGLLYNREWFFRLWTYQEVVLARQASVLCGTKEVSWKNMERLAYAIHTHRLWVYAISEKTGDTTFRGFLYAADIGIARANKKTAESRKAFTNIGQLLDISSKRNCKEPHDRVYAILSSTEQRFSDQVIVDYNMPVTSLYKQCGKVALEQDHEMFYLKLVSTHQGSDNLPSWCLDPSKSMIRPDFAPDHLRAGILKDGPHGGVQTDLDEKDQIAIQGFRADVVTEVVHMDFEWGQVPSQESSMNIREWERQCRLLACKVFGGSPSMTPPIEHICTLGSIPTCADEHESVIKQAYSDQMYHLASQAHNLKNNLPPAERMAAFEWYWKAMMRICPGRSYFSTNGGRVGIGSPRARKGDVVVVFYGCGPAYVLRERRPGLWQFVGDAFLYGFMDLKDTLKEDIKETEWFVIS